jgi:hypothetical protein
VFSLIFLTPFSYAQTIIIYVISEVNVAPVENVVHCGGCHECDGRAAVNPIAERRGKSRVLQLLLPLSIKNVSFL